MRVMLIRPSTENLLDQIDLVCVEPLELEYLAACLRNEGHEPFIYDSRVMKGSLENYIKDIKPDMAAITGYITMKDMIIAYSSAIKGMCSDTIVVVGGVHAALNYQDFYVPTIDYILYSAGLNTFKSLLKKGFDRNRDIDGLLGICYQNETGQWIKNSPMSFDPDSLPLPEREHFHRYAKHFRYVNYSPCAIVKTAYGCPHRCSFCYCCILNESSYQTRSLEKVAAEIEAIDSSYIWIVDDTFLVNRQRVLDLAELLDKRGIHRKYIIYSRADDICQNYDLLPVLKRMGVIDIIVGLEAIDDLKLKDYHKGATEEINRQCIQYLHQYGIHCTGLFLVDYNADRKTFLDLSRWIRRIKPDTFTVSIYTPFPGTTAYEQDKEKLLTLDLRKWDLLHLVIKPTHMRKWLFYTRFYLLYVNLLFPSYWGHLHLIRWIGILIRTAGYYVIKRIMRPGRNKL